MSNIVADNIAKDVFSRYPNAQKVYVTSDGQAFFDERMALNHSKNNRSGKELILFSYDRHNEGSTNTDFDEISSIEDARRPTVKEIAEQLKTASLEAVDQIVAIEDASESPRSSIYKLADKRRAELTNSNEL